MSPNRPDRGRAPAPCPYERVADLTVTGPLSACVREVARWALRKPPDLRPDPDDVTAFLAGGTRTILAVGREWRGTDAGAILLEMFLLGLVARGDLGADLEPLGEVLADRPDEVDAWMARIASAFRAALPRDPVAEAKAEAAQGPCRAGARGPHGSSRPAPGGAAARGRGR